MPFIGSSLDKKIQQFRKQIIIIQFKDQQQLIIFQLHNKAMARDG
jgi:hypothetical protein